MDQKQNKAKKMSRQQQTGMNKTQYETASEFGTQAQENAAAYEQAKKQQEQRQKKQEN
jgi:hypothetical protein